MPRSVLRLRPVLTWQLPTLGLTTVVGVVLMLEDASTSTVSGFTLMAAVTLAGGVIPWTGLAQRWQVVLPLLSLVAVALMGVNTVKLMPSVVLVGLVPVLWLVFEFGRTGAVLAVLSVAGLLCVAFLEDAVLPSSGVAWAQLVMLAAVSVGVCLGPALVAERLRQKQQVLEEQSALVEGTLELAHDQLLVVQAILDSVDAAIVGFDQDGEVILENTSAQMLAALAGTGETEFRMGGLCHVYFEDRVTPVPAGQSVVALAKEGVELPPQTYWVGAPEDQVAVMLSARQIHRRDGDRLGAVVVGWDVTDIVEAVRVREEFLATVSHELRTPLTSIIGYQELIAEQLDPQDHRIAPLLAVARRNASVLASRVSQLLQASGADGPEIKPRLVDVSTLLHDAVAKHRPNAVVAGVGLTTNVEAGVSGHVDPDAWEQVLDNLVSNAIKYTPSGGKVEVALEQTSDGFTLHVVDTGIGMSRAEQDRVFERFYRTTAARDRAIQGLGVGLSITRQIIDAHGGDVSLSSTPGRGTTVTAHVPVCRMPVNV